MAHFALESLRYVRPAKERDFSGTGDLAIPDDRDPSGVRLVRAAHTRFPKPRSAEPADWREWQASLRAHLRSSVYQQNFSSAVRPPISAPVAERVDGELLRREYSLVAADGDRIPIVVLSPQDGAAPKPAILVVHGHVRDGDSGLAQLVLPVDSYMHSAALELAKAGFVTAAIELRGFGMRGKPEFPDHRIVAYNAMLAGGFYKQLVVSDLRIAFDFVSALPQVDAARFGISGVSLGAEIAVEYAALDERVKVISFHSHGGQVGAFHARAAPSARPPHYCHFIPGVVSVMHREDPFLLLAPRPTQGLRSAGEPFVDARFQAGLKRLWSTLDSADALDLREMPVVEGRRDHAFFVNEAIEFFRAHL